MKNVITSSPAFDTQGQPLRMIDFLQATDKANDNTRYSTVFLEVIIS